MNPNSVLSKGMQVKPLEKGEIAVYRLTKSNEIDITRQDVQTGKHKLKSPGYSLCGTKKVFDRFDKKIVIIGNVVNYRQEELPDRTTKMIPETKRIMFEPGKNVTVTHEQQTTYEFLERCNENGDNIFRDPKVPVVFERVNVKKKELQKAEKNELLANAIQWVSAADETELKAINATLPEGKKINLDLGFEHLKNQVFDLALKDPELVMKGSSNKEAKTKIQVMHAGRFGIILFTDGGSQTPRQWYWNEDKNPMLLEVPVGKNKYDALVEHFMTGKDGAKDYQTLVKKIKVFSNHNGPGE
jgi:hypothetical protein